MFSNIKKNFKNFLKKILGIKSHPIYYTHGIHKRIDITSHESFKPFSEIAKKIIEEKKTFLYFDRLLTLYDAVKSMPQNSEVVEVGAKKGGSTKFIASIVNSRTKIYCCDTFEGHTQVDKNDGKLIILGDHGAVDVRDVKKYLEPYKNIKIIMGDILITYKQISLEKVGLIHLDVDTFIPTLFVLNEFFPLIKKGGIFIIDDYLNLNTPGVKKALDQFRTNEKFKDRFYFSTLLSGQAVIVKIY